MPADSPLVGEILADINNENNIYIISTFYRGKASMIQILTAEIAAPCRLARPDCDACTSPAAVSQADSTISSSGCRRNCVGATTSEIPSIVSLESSVSTKLVERSHAKTACDARCTTSGP